MVRVHPVRPRSRSVLTALVVLVGLLGMHALSGGPHSSVGQGHGPMSTTAGDSMSMSSAVEAAPSGPAGVALAAGGDVLVSAADALLSAGATVLDVAVAPTAPEAVSTGLAAVCALLLLSLVLWLALSRSVRARSPGSVGGPPRLSWTSRRRRGPPPDLLALHCVLRT